MNRRSTLLAAACLLLAARPAAARQPPVHTTLLGRAGAGGHDVVAYFTEGRPVPGESRFSHRWNGVDWRFASAANRDRFAASPERYAPQYGGYCAWAVAQGYTAAGDPRHWKVVDGRLYLNYDATVQANWERDIPGFIAAANRHWPAVLDR